MIADRTAAELEAEARAVILTNPTLRAMVEDLKTLYAPPDPDMFMKLLRTVLATAYVIGCAGTLK